MSNMAVKGSGAAKAAPQPRGQAAETCFGSPDIVRCFFKYLTYKDAHATALVNKSAYEGVPKGNFSLKGRSIEMLYPSTSVLKVWKELESLHPGKSMGEILKELEDMQLPPRLIKMLGGVKKVYEMPECTIESQKDHDGVGSLLCENSSELAPFSRGFLMANMLYFEGRFLPNGKIPYVHIRYLINYNDDESASHSEFLVHSDVGPDGNENNDWKHEWGRQTAGRVPRNFFDDVDFSADDAKLDMMEERISRLTEGRPVGMFLNFGNELPTLTNDGRSRVELDEDRGIYIENVEIIEEDPVEAQASHPPLIWV